MTPLRARITAAAVGVALVGATAGCGLGGDDTKTLTAHFDRTVGVYVESDVRVLGVRVGRVTAIEPEGDKVRVDMEYDAKYKIPADASAVVVAPSIVSDRYVQLAPVWTEGPVLADGAELGTDRTGVPLELDEVYEQIDSLNRALGPNGANKDGALSDLLAVGADNLEGNGEQLGETLRDVSTFVETLSGQRDDLFGTVANLQDFTTTIANSDATVRQFNRDLAAVADQLAGEREDLATAIKSLSVAMGEVSTFVRDNKESLSTNVAELAEVTSVLVKQKTALEEFLDTAPTALSNLALVYNPGSGTLDVRDNGPHNASGMPLVIVCTALQEVNSTTDALLASLPGLPELENQCRSTFGAVSGPGARTGAASADSGAPAPSGPALPGLPAGAPSGLPVAGPVGAPAPAPEAMTLGGLLLGAR